MYNPCPAGAAHNLFPDYSKAIAVSPVYIKLYKSGNRIQFIPLMVTVKDSLLFFIMCIVNKSVVLLRFKSRYLKYNQGGQMIFIGGYKPKTEHR